MHKCVRTAAVAKKLNKNAVTEFIAIKKHP
jgi:hypothetical protein